MRRLLDILPPQLRAVLAALTAAVAASLGVQYTGDPIPLILAGVAWLAGAAADWYATRGQGDDE
jgi:hypothetical protein